jgi:hypothetical protein
VFAAYFCGNMWGNVRHDHLSFGLDVNIKNSVLTCSAIRNWLDLPLKMIENNAPLLQLHKEEWFEALSQM